MLYSGTVWRLNDQNPRTLFPYPLKPSMFPQICAHYVVFGNADPIAFAYAYSESGCFDTGPFAYGSIDIVSLSTLLSASVFWTFIPDSTHLSDIKILVCAHPGISLQVCVNVSVSLISMQYASVSLIRYQLIGMRNVSISLIRYRLIGMQYIPVSLTRYRLIGMRNTSVSIIRYHLTGMQYIPISFTIYRLSDMQYV